MKRLKRFFRMSPPLLVTEDTPPDMLTGHMDLRLVLPNGNRVRMSVDRRTPMMDLLVQVTTAYKISPAGHVLQPYGEHGLLPYKPSTPIGALDTWTVHIVPKHQALQNPASKISLKQVQQPFEQTFRFQVNLPKNQLYVLRVTGRTSMGDVLRQACSEKGLDPNKYALRHPKHSDRNLCEELSVMEYGHNQVSMVSNKILPSSVSSEDILAMQAYSEKSSESSSRSLSPDSSVSPQAPVQPSRPLRKRRPAPKPPVQPQQAAKPKQKELQKDPPTNGPVICHSRTSSDSSGYHEASVLSESPDSNNSLPDSLPRRSKLPSKSVPKPTIKLSRSLSNLHHESTTPTTSMKPAQSTSCLAPSRKKKPAPPPPVLSIAEEKEDIMPARSSRTLPSGARLVEEVRVEPGADPSSRLSPSPFVASLEPKGKLYSPVRLNRQPLPDCMLDSHVTDVLRTASPISSMCTLKNPFTGKTPPYSPPDSKFEVPTSPLLKELNSTLNQIQVAPDTQLISVRDLLKKFADSEKPVPNFTLTTYDPSEVRRITKYSNTGVSYYNYDLNNVQDCKSSPRRRSTLKIYNAKPPVENNENVVDVNRNQIVDSYSDVPGKKVIHTKKSCGSITSNIRGIFENGNFETKNEDSALREELDNVANVSKVKQIVDEYSDGSFDSKCSDMYKPTKISIDVSEKVAYECLNTKRKFFADIIDGSGYNVNENASYVEREQFSGTIPIRMESVDVDEFSEKDFNPKSDQSVSVDSSFDRIGEEVIEEINRALDSADFEPDEDEFPNSNKEFRVSPVIGVERIEQVFDEYAAELRTTSIPIVIIKDEDEPDIEENRVMIPRLHSPYLHEPDVIAESPKVLRRIDTGSPKRFERTDSTEIGGFEGPKKSKEPSDGIQSKICFAREESVEIEVVNVFTEALDDSMSMSSSSSEGTTVREATPRARSSPRAQVDPDFRPSMSNKTVTFSPQNQVEIFKKSEGEVDDTPSKNKSPFSPKIQFENLKRRGKKLFGTMRNSNSTTDWNHKDMTEPGICECSDPDVVYVRVPKTGKRNQAFKIKDKRKKKVTFARSESCSEMSENVGRRMKDFLDSKDGLKIEEEPKVNSHATLSDLETERVEDEIERMFEEATREHVSLESGVDVGDSSPGIPSPEASGLLSPDLIPDAINDSHHLLNGTSRREVEEDPFNWEYKLPAPPTFRDVDRDDASSPSLTEYSTMTVGQMKEVLYQPSTAGDRPEPPKVIGVMQRRAVVEELAAVVEDPSRRLLTPREPLIPATSVDKSLDNFKITTYSGTKESVKVYEDRVTAPRYKDKEASPMYEDIVTAPRYEDKVTVPRYEDKATAPRYEEKVTAPRYEDKVTAPRYQTNLARRSSFTEKEPSARKDARPYLSGGVKRSLSQVSPLSRARLGLSASNGNLTTVADEDDGYEPVIVGSKFNLRKTTSELSISIDLPEDRDEYNERVERHSGLQSLNVSQKVLRSILPQLSRSQNALNVIDSTYEPVILKKEVKSYSRPNVNISLSTWGERPKRQISIKSDRDYIVGGVKPPQNGAAILTKPAPVTTPKPPPLTDPKPAEKPTTNVAKSPSFKGPKTLAYKTLETGNTKPLKQILERDKLAQEKVDDHIPIVRAVELKKPYKMERENRMIKEPVPPPCLPVETHRAEDGLVQAKWDKDRLVEAKRDKDRPVSCYLFGYEPLAPPNPPPPPKKFTSIVDLGHPVLKPASSRLLKPRQRDVDPREELMASIRGFGGKNSLRKVSAR